MDSVSALIGRINIFIINPILQLLFVAALVFFMWGIFQFILNAENDEARNAGKRHMVWGVIGMFIMVGFYGILAIVTKTFGVPLP